MNIHESVAALAAYAVEKNLVEQADRVWAVNSLCQALGLDSWQSPETVPAGVPLDMLADFKDRTEAVLGKGSCHVVRIRPVGGVRLA